MTCLEKEVYNKISMIRKKWYFISFFLLCFLFLFYDSVLEKDPLLLDKRCLIVGYQDSLINKHTIMKVMVGKQSCGICLVTIIKM